MDANLCSKAELKKRIKLFKLESVQVNKGYCEGMLTKHQKDVAMDYLNAQLKAHTAKLNLVNETGE